MLANIAQDEKLEYDLSKGKFDMLLSFINFEGAEKLRELEKGGGVDKVALENTGVRAGENFLEDVQSLPSRRMLKAEAHDPYVAKKRESRENKVELKVRTGETSDKPVILTRRIIIKDKDKG